MPLNEKLSDFFSPDEHGTTATYLGETVEGQFDNQYVEVNNRETRAPVFLCAESDVIGIKNKAVITINETIYEVLEPQPDGTGLITLILKLKV